MTDGGVSCCAGVAAPGENRRTHVLGEPEEVLFGGHPRGGRIAAHDGLHDRPLAADVLVGRQLLLQQKFQIRRARLTYWLRVASRNSLRAAA